MTTRSLTWTDNPRRGRRLAVAALAAVLALGGCAQSQKPQATISTSDPGLSPDQVTVREIANSVSPQDPNSGSNLDWFSDNAIILLAATGCVAGAAIGGSVGDCLAGAAIGGLAGGVARITIFDDRDNYSDDEVFIEEVSVELDRVLAENERLVPAAERLADQHAVRIAELNEFYRTGQVSEAAYREELQAYIVDEQALRYIVLANNELLTDIDKALTGVNVPTVQQQRLQDQEGRFLADSGRIEYAQQRLTEALASVPPEVSNL